MLRTIRLHGNIAEEFGDSFRLDVRTPVEAVRALGHQLPGFFDAIAKGDWRIRIKDYYVGEDEITFSRSGDIDLYPVPAGSGGGGRGKAAAKIVVGVVLIAATIVTAGGAAALAAPILGGLATYGTVVQVGIAIALAGVAMMLTPAPEGKEKTKKSRNGYLFDGPVNSNAQGGVVPVAYGRVLIGGIIISGSITSEAVLGPSYGDGEPESDSGSTGGAPTGPRTLVTSHDITVDTYSSYIGFDYQKFGRMSKRNINSTTTIGALYFISGLNQLWLEIEVEDLQRDFIKEIAIKFGNQTRFQGDGDDATLDTAGKSTIWKWKNLGSSPFNSTGETLTLKITHQE